MSARTKRKKRKLTRADMCRLWPTNVYLWTPRMYDLWVKAR